MNIKQYYLKADILGKLILINLGIFLVIKIISLFLFLGASNYSADYLATEYLAVPALPAKLLIRFYTPFTYMFLHTGFWHIFGNMLWLWFMGKIFIDFLDKKQLFAVYIIGGLSGALMYILSFNIFPAFTNLAGSSVALGASASVTAIVIATAVFKPDYNVRLFGIVPVALKWIGIFFVIYDLLTIQSENPGGHIAHLGGALYGLLFAQSLKKGKDITKGFNRMIDNIVSLFSRRRSGNMYVSYKNSKIKGAENSQKESDGDYNQRQASDRERTDMILEKISKNGYDSLSKEEKEFLFKMSNK